MAHYSGELSKSGKRHGRGNMSFSNGDHYEGEWRKGLMEGSGTMTYSNGDVFSGHFKKGLYHGKGVFHWANGEAYDGHYRSGERSGQGSMRYLNFDEYSGMWRADKHCGKGCYRYAGGDVFRGQYKDGVKHGHGDYAYASTGDRYTGGFINDKYSGRGQYWWASSGARFDGEYRSGKRNGFGVYISEAGQYEGEWKDGHWSGYGVFRYPDGETKMGLWAKDQLLEQWDSVPRHISDVHNAFLLGLKQQREANRGPCKSESGVEAPSQGRQQKQHLQARLERRGRAALKEQWDSRPVSSTLTDYDHLIQEEPGNTALLADRAAFYEHLASKAEHRQEELCRRALEDFTYSLSLDARDGEAAAGHARVSNMLHAILENKKRTRKGTATALPSVSAKPDGFATDGISSKIKVKKESKHNRK